LIADLKAGFERIA